MVGTTLSAAGRPSRCSRRSWCLLPIALCHLAMAGQLAPAGDEFVCAVFTREAPKAKPSIVYRAEPVALIALADAAVPSIDGELTDVCWQQAPAFALVTSSDSHAPTAIPPVALIRADRAAIYFGIVLPLTEGAETLSTAQRRDLNVWQDESVELFVDPGRTRQHYFQFILNTMNTQQDSEGWNGDWNGEWKSAVVVRDGGGDAALPPALRERQDLGAARNASRFWTCEIAVPHATLGAQSPKVNDAWGLNICRNDKRQKEGRIWAKVRISNHEPASFGELRFVDSIPDLRFASLWHAGAPVRGTNAVEIGIHGGEAMKARVVATLSAPGGKELNLPTDVSQADGKCSLTLPLTATGEHRLDLSLRAGDAETVCDRARFVFNLEVPPTPLALRLDQREYYLSEKMLRVFVYTQTVSAIEARAMEIVLHSAGGEALRRATVPLPSAAAEIEMDIRGLQAGSYALRASLGGHATEQRFAVLPGSFEE